MATRTACQPGWETLCRCTCIHIYMIWLFIFFWFFIRYNVLNGYGWWTLHCLILMSHWFNCIPEKRVFLPSPKPIDIRRLHNQSRTPTCIASQGCSIRTSTGTCNWFLALNTLQAFVCLFTWICLKCWCCYSFYHGKSSQKNTKMTTIWGILFTFSQASRKQF